MRKLVVLLVGGLGVSWKAWNLMTEAEETQEAVIGFGMTSTACLYQGLNIACRLKEAAIIQQWGKYVKKHLYHCYFEWM
jgi:hypothetical protein